MNKVPIIVFAFCFIVSCNSNKKPAIDRLNRAIALSESGAYSAAKIEIDSIRSLYPKEYDVIKKSIILMREVESKEQSRNSIYCDSIIATLKQQATQLQQDFVFEKQSDYERIGNWILPSQRIERNTRHSYLRCGVNENGEMFLVSVYYGKTPIRYNAIRVYTSDSVYAETLPVPPDGSNNYTFEDGGMISQIISYTKKNENGVSGFIRLYGYNKIKVIYVGGKPYSYILDEETKKAILKTNTLAQVLTDIGRFQKEKKLADAKLIYLAKKKEQNK